MALFAGMDAVAKWLVADFSIFQILAILYPSPPLTG